MRASRTGAEIMRAGYQAACRQTVNDKVDTKKKPPNAVLQREEINQAGTWGDSACCYAALLKRKAKGLAGAPDDIAEDSGARK